MLIVLKCIVDTSWYDVELMIITMLSVTLLCSTAITAATTAVPNAGPSSKQEQQGRE
jgi:hypothetical protein